MNTHEGVCEDGVLATCGICGVQTHMLDPEEMDWICDPCSEDGWSGIRSAWRLTPGDVILWEGVTYAVLAVEDFPKGPLLSVRKEDGSRRELLLRGNTTVYIHMNREEV